MTAISEELSDAEQDAGLDLLIEALDRSTGSNGIPYSCKSLMRRAHKQLVRLQSLRSGNGGEVRVKPLEWTDFGSNQLASVSGRNPINAPYKIYRDGGSFEPVWAGSLGDMYPTLNEAKAAAFAHYSNSILSALDIKP